MGGLMKKAVLGFGIFGVYLIYSVGIRHQQPLIPKPASLISSNTKSGGSSSGSSTASATSSTTSAAGPPSPTPASSSSKYQDGTYVGSVADAYYGNVQVSVTISGGRISKVKFLQYPNTHSTSVYINQQVMPYLQQEAIQAQSSNVQMITGATFTSQAFVQSLQAALNKA